MSATSPLARAALTAILDELRSDPAVCAEVADVLAPHLWKRMEAPAAEPHDGWINTKQAAKYLGTTPNALQKLTAARLVPFEQDGPDCRCWFKRSALDAWRKNGGARRCPPQATHSGP